MKLEKKKEKEFQNKIPFFIYTYDNNQTLRRQEQ